MKTLANLSYDELLARAAAVFDLPELRVDVSPFTEGGKRWWTKGEGLKKWATKPRPWTALYHHILKWEGMTPHYAARIASSWYHIVFGHWPGEHHGHGKGKLAHGHRSAVEDGAGYGTIAVTANVWLRERASEFLLEPLPELADGEPMGDLDEDTLALLLALAELDVELDPEELRSFDPNLHKRWPKGHPLAGKFRPMVDLLKQAIANFNNSPGKSKHPFENFNRDQLLNAAKARNIKLSRGEDRDSIADKLLADLGGKSGPKQLKAAKASAKTAALGSGPAPDGLDELDEQHLNSLAREFEVPTNTDRDTIIAGLRAQGAVSPAVRHKQIDALHDLRARLKNMGRRPPADPDGGPFPTDGPLGRAVEQMAQGADNKTVAKILREDAAKMESKEDADTMRFLASDLISKKAKPPTYLNDKGNIDLGKLGEASGIDLKKWMPLNKEPLLAHGSGGNWEYTENHPFARRFHFFNDLLADPQGQALAGRYNAPRAKIAREMREAAKTIREWHHDLTSAKTPGLFNPLNSEGRRKERQNFIAGALDAANDMERLADLVEAAKVPPKKRGKTLGGTVLGEPVHVDESKFATRNIHDVVSHRGEKLPRSFKHAGSGTALVLAKNRQHRPGLTESESRALDLYTVGVVADGLNGSLRKGQNVHGTVKGPGGTIDLDEVSAGLDSALAESRLTEDTVLWRGALPTTSDYRRLVPGAIYTDGGYMSTSTDEQGARQTIAWRQNNGTVPAGRKQLLFKILAPAGTNAAVGHERVSEALLPRGQELRVVRLDESGNIPVAVMEVIPKTTDPGHVRGRSLVDHFDYDAALAAKGKPSQASVLGFGGSDAWLAEIQKAQRFDGKPRIVSPQKMDDLVAGGAMELFRGIRGDEADKLAEQFRTGDLYPGMGVYGSGTYTTPKRDVAMKYGTGTEKGLLRIALRRDARVINYDELVKLPALKGITTSTQKLVAERQAALSAVDPTDAKAVQAIIDKYEALLSKRGAKSQIGADLGRVAALLGYDAIIKPEGLKRHARKSDPTAEIVILNRTAAYVEQAIP